MQYEQSFSIGITYWPRRTAYAGWKAFDSSAARDELAHIADLGCDTVRICLFWEDFQPRPARINGRMMRALERTLDAAHTVRLRVAVVLFAGAMGGFIHLPSWATGISPGLDLALIARFGAPLETVTPPLFFDGRYRETPVRDIYGEPEQREAQHYLIREVIGYFSAHPAVSIWQIGYDLDRARTHRSAEEACDWLATLVEHARERGATRLVCATSPRALARRDTVRPEHMAELCDLVAIHTHPYEPLRVEIPWHIDYVTFLHALTASLAGKPVLVASLGLATQPEGKASWVADSAFGQPIRAYLADEEQQATFLEAALNTLYHAGAMGVWLAAYADVPETLWEHAPFDRTKRERTLGVVRANGREKLAAYTLRSFAKRIRRAEQSPEPARARVGVPATLDIDSESYWYNPAQSMRQLFGEWQQSRG